jgi:predicted RNA-binding Zn ribbon-like protein
MNTKTVTEIRLLGGHPALDFVNTVDARRDRWGPDALVAYSDLVIWGERLGLIDPALAEQLRLDGATRPSAASAALTRAKVARELLYAAFLAEVRGTVVAPTDGAALGCLVDAALAKRTLKPNAQGFAWSWTESDLDAVLHRVVLAAADLLASRGDRRALRECPGANCGWLFLDRSRGGRRHWCSEETCGTRSRVERFRARSGRHT